MPFALKGARLWSPPDGYYRVLVDRLWPRGIRRVGAPFDEWIKESAPSTELRLWYGHDAARHQEFVTRYRAELSARQDEPPMQHLLELVRSRPVVLLTTTRAVEISHVPVLASFLEDAARRETDAPPP